MRVICVFQSPPETMKQYVMKQTSPPFTMLCDPKREMYTKYHVKCSKRGFKLGVMRAKFNGTLKIGAAKGFQPGPVDGRVDQMPADFLIDEEGKIVDAFRANFADAHIPWKRIEAFIPKHRQCKCGRSDCLSTNCRQRSDEARQDYGDIFMG